MRKVAILALCVLSVSVSACNTLKDVTNNSNCVTKVSLRGSYGTGLPSGTYSASATCNPTAAKGLAGIPAAPPAEDKVP